MYDVWYFNLVDIQDEQEIDVPEVNVKYIKIRVT